ncbi:MAG: OmpA family protein [Chitinophagales bacterium]|nr:OmpA family protein [Chitinophagales bacterium]
MSKKFLYIAGIILTILVGTLLYWKYCCNCCSKGKPVLTDDIPMGDYNMFNLSGPNINYQSDANFRFPKNGYEHLTPVHDSINAGLDILKAHFDKVKDQRLKITGYYTTDEKNTSAFPNMGLARANNVKNYLAFKGISAERIDIAGEERERWRMDVDTLVGPVDFLIEEIDVKATPTVDYKALREKINAAPLILYFETNQAEINLTPEERQKVADLVNYLDKVPSAKISCVGHTDNTGDRNTNIRLGQERADFAKAYLVKNGIAADKIVSSSKGPDEPIVILPKKWTID